MIYYLGYRITDNVEMALFMHVLLQYKIFTWNYTKEMPDYIYFHKLSNTEVLEIEALVSGLNLKSVVHKGKMPDFKNM